MQPRKTSLSILFLILVGTSGFARDRHVRDYTKDQQLVIAAFRLEVSRVKELLARGADPNAQLGFYDGELFRDKWTLGYSPIGSSRWTPLLAVANSDRAPQPDKPAENTAAGLDEALARRESIEPKVIKHRDQRRVEIMNLLIDAGVDLNAQDGYGATALYSAVTKGYVKLAMLLIKKGANVNTSTGIYIDGPGDVTPTHLATRYPRVLAALLGRSANASAPDTSGDTPLHWAVREGNVRSVELLVRAGADVHAKNAEGDTAADLCEPISLFGEQPFFADEERAEACRQIRALLETGGGRP